jgi:predicted ribosome quality control (RQC) complex YloA/Tae2 family protein
MRSLTSLDIHKLLEELSFINNGFIRNIKSGKNELYFLIYRGKEYWLKIVPGNYFCIADEKPAESIDFGFTTILKNSLKGRKFTVSMHNSDRIIELQTENNKLIIEMFSKGNVVLLRDGMVERTLFQRKFESREITSGKEYVYPPGGKYSFEDMHKDFSQILLSSEKESTVKALAIDFSMGGYYAEEICFRADIDKGKKPAELESEELRKLKKNFDEIMDEKRPNIINNEILSVVELKHLTGDRQYFDTINSAVISFFKRDEYTRGYNPVKKEMDKAKERLEEYEKQIDYVNNNYERIENAIKTIRDSSKELEERKKKLDELGFMLNGRNLIPKDFTGFNIDMLQDRNYLLSGLHQKAKRLKNIDTEAIKAKTRTIKRIKVKNYDQWYSKFRYFTTSDNKLAVIGRDNNQNEAIIEKHVEKQDLVGHADVFGSPFGVIKAGNGGITRKDMEETASIIAAYSSAWRAGAANLDVYFVKPEQVTKTPPSGESLKKGAFYIEGKRDYVKNAAMGVYISIEVTEDIADIRITPYEPKRPFFLIKPGNKKRDEVIRKINRALSQKYGVEVNNDYIDRLLPQGRSSLEKIKLF